MLILLPSAPPALHYSQVVEKVNESCSAMMKVKNNKLCHSLCIGSFCINHQKLTGANMLFFHTVFTENNADLAVTHSKVAVM